MNLPKKIRFNGIEVDTSAATGGRKDKASDMLVNDFPSANLWRLFTKLVHLEGKTVPQAHQDAMVEYIERRINTKLQ